MHIKAFAIAILALSLTGCAYTFSYNGINYPNATQAKTALHNDMQYKLGAVQEIPTRFRPGGTATFFIPSESLFRSHGVVKIGNGSLAEPQIKYIVDVQKTALQTHASAISKANLFDRLNIKYTDTFDVSFGDSDDYIIWSEPVVGSNWEWFVKNKAGETFKIGWQLSLPPLEVFNDFNIKLASKVSKQSVPSSIQTPTNPNNPLRITSTGTGFWIDKSDVPHFGDPTVMLVSGGQCRPDVATEA